VALRVAPFTGSGEQWDSAVRTFDGWTHFHLYGWRSIMERVLGHECLYLAATTESGTISGVMPLVRVKSPLFGHFLVSMPFLNYGGPLGSPDGVRALATHATQLAERDQVKMLELRSRTELPIDLPVSHRKITVVLDIPDSDHDALWKRLDSKVRSQVRRPQKEGVVVRFGRDQVDPFFDVFSRHMRDLGTPTQSRRLFRVIADTFGDDVTFACAYQGDVAIAAGCGFRWGDEFEMTWASSLREYNKISPNMLVYWECMKRSAEQGVTLFNFGRCTPGAGTHKFKRQWGSRDETLWWYEQRSAGATTPSEGQGALSLGPKVWQKLPLGLATALGPRIVRFIP
jgi:FemAB-related protein (PEP-CTERM system-associated)